MAGRLDSGRMVADPVDMKNITVSVDDDIYHRARIRAAEQRTSVSALVRRALQDLAGEETDFERSVREEDALRERVRSRGCRFSAEDRLTREQVHDRDALR